MVNTPSHHATLKTSTIQPHTNSIVSSNDYKPSSIPPLYSKIPTLASSSHTPSLTSAWHQTAISASINTHPPVSSVGTADQQQVLPSPLVLFHAFGTLQFHHLSGLNYYANGTLKVRAPLTTQLFNSTSEVQQSITPTPSISNTFSSTGIIRQPISSSPSTTQIFTTSVESSTISNTLSSTRIIRQPIPSSPRTTQIFTTLVESSTQPAFELTSSTMGVENISSSFLKTSALSTANTVSSLVPSAASSSILNMVSSSAVFTTSK